MSFVGYYSFSWGFMNRWQPIVHSRWAPNGPSHSFIIVSIQSKTRVTNLYKRFSWSSPQFFYFILFLCLSGSFLLLSCCLLVLVSSCSANWPLSFSCPFTSSSLWLNDERRCPVELTNDQTNFAYYHLYFHFLNFCFFFIFECVFAHQQLIVSGHKSAKTFTLRQSLARLFASQCR